ncbi:radical SAM protein [Candidatus Woesearchaeota archaeon]|nr:radical SAM protein [Candidatus Woesearchaeota archaeon]
MHSQCFSILKGKGTPKFKNADFKQFIYDIEKLYKSCELCERKCKVNRFIEKGFCRATAKAKIFGAHAHYGEEPELIPSGTLFFAGCNLQCVYCQNAPHSVTPELGDEWSDRQIAEWIDKCKCKNINFVTPDCYLLNIVGALKNVKANIPVVWNSSSYYSEKTAELIKEIVDLYLLDFRYFDNKCATKLSSAPNYAEAAKRNHLIACRNGDLIIRVLVMPNHTDCCAKPILRWIKDNLGENTRVNILEQYHPAYRANKYPEINRRLTMKEYSDVVSYAKKIGLKNLV